MADRPETEKKGTEQFDREISYRAVGIFVVLLTLVTVVTFAGLWFAGVDLRDRMAARDPAPSPVAEAQRSQVPPGPLLQTHPYRDLELMEAREDSILHTYAWIDRDEGVVRIPLDEAIERVVEEGLPTFPPTPDAETSASSER